ncbi:isopeptide-forming domain-containing fimbrial protein [Bifidobacterium amazonense]|uniref:Isopeptide-forming domain-containing fimbrial protein n=1 Tax=Bifidobacterium amazonense TaxID=2809027 RepID=A0ABS9VVR0_9BIFI|nr:isopeptide-forming domain-containing fimbrial protein [Bifidobacterium amazonense]MCH9276157.1 isopeptide-forming domain-containing fimbrial protein [Bifidobacterium amazonense]
MKKLGKALLGLVAAVAMLFTGLTIPTVAMAEDGETTTTTAYTITVKNNVSGYVYSAYQVFAGDLDDKGVLSNITWGSNIDATGQSAIITALKGDATFGSGTDNVFAEADVQSAADVAKVLGDNYSANTDDADTVKASKAAAVAKFAEIVGEHTSGTATTSTMEGTGESATYKIRVPSPGYYLVKNTQVPSDAENAFGTDYILEVVKDVEVEPKGEVPTVEKKVKDVNDSDSTKTDNNQWQDSADHDVTDTVSYRLKGTLPNNYGDYDSYKYQFTDVLSKGLTLNADSVKVYAVSKANYDDQLTCTSNAKNKCVEIKKLADNADTNDATGYKLTTSTTDTDLLKGAYEGGTVLHVDFADLKKAVASDSSALNIDHETVIIVEYTATLNKNAKVGAEGNPNQVRLTYSNNPTNGGDGNTGHTPWDKVTVFTFKITVNKKDNLDNDLGNAAFKLSKWNGNEWQEVKDYKTEATDTKYTFEFSGLDDGKYKLEESKTPDGYNTWAGLEFWIVSEHDATKDDPQLTSLKFYKVKSDGTADTTAEITDFTGMVNAGTQTGVAQITVKNYPGSNLPSTGGMGTVILYALGGAFVVAAGLWFGLRRRFSNR